MHTTGPSGAVTNRAGDVDLNGDLTGRLRVKIVLGLAGIQPPDDPEFVERVKHEIAEARRRATELLEARRRTIVAPLPAAPCRPTRTRRIDHKPAWLVRREQRLGVS